MSEQKKTLSENVINLSKRIEEGINVDGKTGIAAPVNPSSLYKDSIPEDLSEEIINRVGKFNSDFIAASVYGFGNKGIPVLKDNKDLEEVSLEIKMAGHDKLSITIPREKSYVNHLVQGGETITKFGSPKVTYETRAGKNSGALKLARQLVSDLAQEALGKK